MGRRADARSRRDDVAGTISDVPTVWDAASVWFALIDGADATSVLKRSTLYSQFGRDTFSDIQVKTTGVDALTPLALGAVMTVASQSGTDRFQGAAAFQYEPKEWNAHKTLVSAVLFALFPAVICARGLRTGPLLSGGSIS